MHHPGELLSDEPVESERHRRLIVAFWAALEDAGDRGATTWEALDRVHERVRTALHQRPPDIMLAESLTARAALLIAGGRRT